VAALRYYIQLEVMGSLLFWNRMNLQNTFNPFFNVSSYTLNMKNICDAWLMRTHIRDFEKEMIVELFHHIWAFLCPF
jgi:hypothetical protein